MTKRRAIGLGVVLILIAIVVPLAVFPTWRTIVVGIIQGEKFSHGMPRSYWVDRLKDEDVNLRFEAVENLGQLSRKAPSPDPVLFEALKDENADVRLTAANVLGEKGLGYKERGPPRAEAMESVPALIEALQDKHAGVRKEAAISILRNVGAWTWLRWRASTRAELVAELSRALDEENVVIRQNAQKALDLLKKAKPEQP